MGIRDFVRMLAMATLGFSTVAAAAPLAAPALERAVFAGGCFWCMQPPFDGERGVKESRVGYTGGHVANPTYEQVSSGKTGHVEAVEVTFDPKMISYQKLVQIFWENIDPTDGDGQFADRGSQYHTVIFFNSPAQRTVAEASKKALVASGKFKEVRTRIEPATTFYPAEEYHQKYYEKNAVSYGRYKKGSGRSDFLEKTWKSGAPTKADLMGRLTPLQYEVTQKGGTEPPFQNAYWNNKRPGIYVDVVSGEPLFSSLDKYDSGTGWPSFTRPLSEAKVKMVDDETLSMRRTEVRSGIGNSHLGHVFDDGPAETGKRYCINSASLRFVPVEELKKEGLERFLPLFKR